MSRRARQLRALLLITIIMLLLIGRLESIKRVHELKIEVVNTERKNDELLHEYEELRRMYDFMLQDNILLVRENQELRKELEEIGEGISATITRYAPLDPSAKEGMCYSGDPTVTATGMATGPNVVAVDPDRIPYGTRLRIEGFDREFIAGDTGQAMRQAEGILIDVFSPTRSKALEFGRQDRRVWIIEEEGE